VFFTFFYVTIEKVTSVIETEILHVVEFDGLQLLAVQQLVAEGHPADEPPAGHHPHHGVIAADLHVGCRGGGDLL